MAHLGSFVRLVALALLLGAPSGALAQGLTVTPSVSGPNITLAWSAVPGADTYVVEAGVVPGVYVVSLPATASGFAVTAPAVGTYYLRAVARANGVEVAASAPVPITVTTLVAPPSPPSSVEAFVYCGGVLLRWAPGAGGTPSGYVVDVSGPVSGSIPTTGRELFAAAPPQGAYAFSVRSVGAGGVQSAASVPVAFTVAPGPGTVPPPAMSSFAYGTFLSKRWAPVPGAASYSLQAFQNGVPVLNQAVGAGTTRISATVPLGTYTLRVSATAPCGGQSTAAEVTTVVDGAPPAGPRTPNPAPGQRLPLPGYGQSVVFQLAAERRDLVLQSCAERGGNNRFMFEVVRRLRERDTRWGLNWKRGNRGDLSQDIVTYNFGSRPDEDTTDVYIIDIIVGHCGASPGPFWIDQTIPTRDAGTIGRWTLLPYIEAGYTP